MPITTDELSQAAMGGTERMKYALAEKLDPSLLNQFQIICSRVREVRDDLIPIYWLHDLPGDPESAHLKNGGWRRFKKLVFVSNWQMQQYLQYYDIPWSAACVLKNAIEPIARVDKTSDKIRLIYHTTPHRGLALLVPVFIALAEKYNNIQLDVFSSFKIYGWEQRDLPYAQLFQQCRDHPQINYHGFQENKTVRAALQQAHIFAYPNIWPETSCIALMEAMSAGCLCIHPNYAALHETAANFTWMYQYHEDAQMHMHTMYQALDGAIQKILHPDTQHSLMTMRNYVAQFYSWDRRIVEWTNFLENILATR